MDPVLSRGYWSSTSALANPYIRHVTRSLRWGILQALGWSREGFPILREKHNAMGLRLVEYVAVGVFNASCLSKWILGASCLADLKLLRKVGERN